MNTAALKNFAPAVRRQLMEAVTRKLDYVLTAQTPDLLTTYAPQVAALRRLAATDRAGLIDRVAYTWFNRLAALRFMDAREWHPFRSRVLTPASAAETQPELLRLTRNGALPEELHHHTNSDRLNGLLDGAIPSPDPQGEVYRHLVLAACHFYHALLPNIFEKLDDETELLLPDDLLTEHSVAHGFRTEISDADCAEVELLGWLYQFYISEKKDQVMARKSAVPKDDIPAVTQLFTPHWIVRYLVENSLGRLWLLNRPQSKLREQMPYYIEGEAETDFLKITKPEELKVIDPASGSGHMLTYAFDLLCHIYEEEGYAPSEIPGLILRHNLFGVDICPRAAQLAELALVFKARAKSRRFLQPEQLVRPNILELREVRYEEGELSRYFQARGVQPSALQPDLVKLLHQFDESKNFGSLIDPRLSESEIQSVRSQISNRQSAIGNDLMVAVTHQKVLRALDQAEYLCQRYQIVVANPPYMGWQGMNSKLAKFVTEQYPNGKADLMTCFVERAYSVSADLGYIAVINLPSWMFLKSFEGFREWLLSKNGIISLLHNGRGVFGADFGTVAFVLRKSSRFGPGVYGRLFEKESSVDSEEAKLKRFFDRSKGWNKANQRVFAVIPGSPIAYWISPRLAESFTKHSPLSSAAIARKGLVTAANETFVRFWHEVDNQRIGFGFPSRESAKASSRKWFSYAKGGPFRKWYGNLESIVNWENDGYLIQTTKHPTEDRVRATNFNLDSIFKPAVCWTVVTIASTSFRIHGSGYLYDAAAGLCQPRSQTNIISILGMLNSRVAQNLLALINPTINLHPGYLEKLPFPTSVDVIPVVSGCVDVARADWDNFETSWDFRDLPLLRPDLKAATLVASWKNWEAHCQAAIRRMQELETENNRLFIAAYGLQNELKPEVPEDQITLARADARKDMAAFLSYAVGCMMGRYSLDAPGLILANAGDTVKEYLSKLNRPLDKLSFTPDEDGIIPVLDGEWFEDDIVARTRDFLRVTFGDATLRENLRFIEDSLGKDLRKYFLNDFYKDHLQTYKKRPIYWLVQSPKKGFSVLIYLHRYTRDTMNLVLNRYLREYQTKLRNRLAHVTELQVTAATAKAKTEARKEVEKLTKILAECDEWERQTMLPLAQARIELDLDDGVKANYLKLGEALAPIAGLAAKEED